MSFGSICAQFFRASGGEFKWSLTAVNRRAAQLLRPGVISATLLGVRYSSSSLDKSYGSNDISKMYVSHWEPLGVSESCRTRIPGWSNPRVYWTNAVAIRCTWEHLGAPATSLGAAGSASGNPLSVYHKPGSTSNHCRAVWEKRHLLWECCWCTWKS